MHFVSVAFDVGTDGNPQVVAGDPHVVDYAWVPVEELGQKLVVPVVRDPLLAHLGDPSRRYFGFADAGITIAFSDAP